MSRFWPRYLTWIAACAVGEAIGLTSSAAVSSVVGLAGIEGPFQHRAAMVGAGVLEGLCLGACQILALRIAFPVRLGPWLAASGIGMGLGWLFATSLPVFESELPPSTGETLVFGITMGVVLGAALSTAQALVLRYEAPVRAYILAGAFGWGAGMVVSFVGASELGAGAWEWSMIVLGLGTGAGVGATVGVVTGVVVASWPVAED